MPSMVSGSINSKWEFPPQETKHCIAVVSSSELETAESLRKRIKNCETIIAVDGGLNHCDKMNIIPHCIVGDFDSVQPSLLAKYASKVTPLQRAKDITDLEEAIEKASSLSAYAQVVIFGGLGGRIDHTLGNIFLLLRKPGQLFLESEHQILFGISEKMGRISLLSNSYKSIALFPLSGVAENIAIESQDAFFTIPFIDKNQLFVLPFKEDYHVSIGKGEAVVVLDKREFSSFVPLPRAPLKVDLSIHQPLIQVFHYLIHQSLYFKEVQISSEKETLINIQPSSGKISFSSQLGQTISLIPLFGPAKGIKTTGLKWELGERVNQLDKNFIGISNVCLQNEFSVQVEQGELLCVINDLIDLEMVKA